MCLYFSWYFLTPTNSWLIVAACHCCSCCCCLRQATAVASQKVSCYDMLCYAMLCGNLPINIRLIFKYLCLLLVLLLILLPLCTAAAATDRRCFLVAAAASNWVRNQFKNFNFRCNFALHQQFPR